MKMKKILTVTLALAFMAYGSARQVQADYSWAIPSPVSIELTQGAPFTLAEGTRIVFPEGDSLMERNAQFLADFTEQLTGLRLSPSAESTAAPAIYLRIAERPDCSIEVDSLAITIVAPGPEGVFRAIQTLRKSLPLDVTQADTILLPAVKISDAPAYPYRGMHLDVSRHFFPKEFIKEYIDILALHGLNVFHWHLSDNQGFRLEIDGWPRLTEGIPHYTQDDAREIVEYAAERYVTVVPEIDMPGHMAAAIQAYPELSCVGEQRIDPVWGATGNVLCLGNERTYDFINDVVDQLVEIFPSELIHMGGDEVSPTRWKACPRCQQVIKDEELVSVTNGPTAEQRLQSHGMQAIAQRLSQHGRRMIAWDEVLDGDPLPDSTVIMIWRNPKSAVVAHERGHQVVMCPGSHCYFDYYQTANTESEPRAFGGYIPVEKVYAFNPVNGLTPDEASAVIGAQANLWTESVATPQHAEYMILPRLAALSEVQWRGQDEPEFQAFLPALQHLMALYQRLGYTYSNHLYDVHAQMTRLPEQRSVEVTLTNVDGSPIRYTLDGTVPTQESLLYTDPLLIDFTSTLCASTIRDARADLVAPTIRQFDFGKSSYRNVELDPTYLESPRYAYDGKITLVDGIRGKLNFGSGEWLGFVGGGTSLTIDFENPEEISSALVSCLVDLPSWISGCRRIAVEVSDDGANFVTIAEKEYPEETDPETKAIREYTVEFSPVTTRYARIAIDPCHDFPPTHDGYGGRPYMFIDEVVVR